MTALQPLWNFPDRTPPLQAKPCSTSSTISPSLPVLQVTGENAKQKAMKKVRKRGGVEELVRPVDVYGGIHLLRLLIKVPSLIAQYNEYNQGGSLEAPGHEVIQRRLDELIQFLSGRHEKYFGKGDDYAPAE